MTELSPLFQPFGSRRLTVSNRFVMAPMTRRFSPGGIPGKAVAEYYARRAASGVGLIISEGTGVDRPGALNELDIPNLHSDAALAGWARVLSSVHGAGGAMAPQLWHVGALADEDSRVAFPAESPSGFAKPGQLLGKTMSEEDIADAIDAFARAAQAASALGFDAVELHGAHGYLIDQFFWGETNRRSDRFGGNSIAARARFACEVIRAVRKSVGPDLALILRISQWKMQKLDARIATTATELEQWLAPLADAGVDIFHCSQRRFWEPEFPGSDLNLAGWVKKLLGKPTITVGSVGISRDALNDPEAEGSLFELARRLDRGDFDLVAVGRALLHDPFWLQKVRAGKFAEVDDFDPSSRDILT
jgi:2,4-dienoyl-CoA reductase-like NADH-dependent reductase (Old Yellow Enzyme family)